MKIKIMIVLGTLLLVYLSLMCPNAIADVSIDQTSFPDETFRKKISTFDTDHDGILNNQEISKVEFIAFSEYESRNIRSLTGIEHFNGLTQLICKGAYIETIDLRNNVNLRYLDCSFTKLSEIDLSKNLELRMLNCSSTAISQLNLYNNSEIISINCSSCKLKSLDLGNNEQIKALNCKGNQLKLLDLSNNKNLHTLNCSNNSIAELIIHNCPNLRSISCSNNQMKLLDVKECENLVLLSCTGNLLTKLELGNKLELSSLICYDNHISEIDLSKCKRLLTTVRAGIKDNYLGHYYWLEDENGLRTDRVSVDSSVRLIDNAEKSNVKFHVAWNIESVTSPNGTTINARENGIENSIVCFFFEDESFVMYYGNFMEKMLEGTWEVKQDHIQVFVISPEMTFINFYTLGDERLQLKDGSNVVILKQMGEEAKNFKVYKEKQAQGIKAIEEPNKEENEIMSFWEYLYSEKREGLSIGSHLFFGRYEQDNNSSNGTEPIEWIVLDIDDDQIMLISKDILDIKESNLDPKGTTWEKSTIRNWLNGSFVSSAFNNEEQERIILNETTNYPYYYNTETTIDKNTYDRVFLLSVEEATEYFPREADKKCKESDYSQKINSDEKKYWLLRTYKDSDEIYEVGNVTGEIRAYGIFNIFANKYVGVRPAICLNIASINQSGIQAVMERNSEKENNIDDSLISTTSSQSPVANYEASQQAGTVFGDWVYILNTNDQAVIVHYNGKETNINLPWNIQGHMVTEIGKEAFAGNGNIQTVVLPIGVTMIRENAFLDCENLRSVEFPSRLATIEDGAFLGCEKLMELEIPDSVAELGENCFESWTKLTGSEESIAGAYARAVGLNYGETVQPTTEPVDESEYYQYEIRNGGAVITSYLGEDSEVIIPSSLGGYPVRVIGENAFSSRYDVEKVVVPEGVTELERIAFRYCPGMTEIQLPSTLKIIGDNAFYRCEGLEEIVIPEGVTELGDRAFRGCLSLKKVTIPRSLKTIPWYAFFECHERLIIYGYGGSSAEIYADRKGYNFVEIRE